MSRGRYPPPYPEPFVSLTVVSAEGLVVTDVKCRRCAYNLRTLPVSGFCPECGAPVNFSVRGDDLRYADPAWLDKLRWGVNGIIASVLVSLFLLVFAIAVGRGAVTEAGSLLASVLLLGGAWLLTAPDPSGLGEDRYGWSRKIIRGTLLAVVAGEVTDLFERAFLLPEAATLVAGIVQVAGTMALLVGFFTLLHYCQKLALRVPDHFIAGRARFLKWAFAGSLVAMVLFTCAGAFLANAGGAELFVCCTLFPVLAAMLIFGVMYLLMLERLGRSIKEQARIARHALPRTGVPGDRA